MDRYPRPTVLGLVVLVGVVAAGCADRQRAENALERIRNRGELVVLTRPGPTTYVAVPTGAVGPEFDMVEAFAAHLGVVARYHFRPTEAALLESLKAGEGDVVAAGLRRAPQKGDGVRFGPTYLEVETQVVCRRDRRQPSTIEEIADVRLVAVEGSRAARRLAELRGSRSTLRWKERSGTTAAELLEDVAVGRVDCAAVGSHVFAAMRRRHPGLQTVLSLGDTAGMAWAIEEDATRLARSLRRWFEDFESSGQLGAIWDRYYSFVDAVDAVDVWAFRRHVETRLPAFRSVFERASVETALPWTLLAALGYQESHWNPLATSPTGVRGLMMLTGATAALLGVVDRLDPEASVLAGARYVSTLYATLPDDVPDPDRTWLALAAYNVGLGHVFDARVLTRRQGKNPNRWADVRSVLPLLSDPHYHTTLQYGFARGHEPVRYVERIREYWNLLDRIERSRPPRKPVPILRPPPTGPLEVAEPGVETDPTTIGGATIAASS